MSLSYPRLHGVPLERGEGRKERREGERVSISCNLYTSENEAKVRESAQRGPEQKPPRSGISPEL